MTPGPIAGFLAVAALAGVANACIWAPLASITTHNLPVREAGACAGAYNTMGQIGGVLGSAAIGAIVVGRMSAHDLGDVQLGEGTGLGPVSAQAAAEFSAALRESAYLPAAMLVLGAAATASFVAYRNLRSDREPATESASRDLKVAG